MKRRRLLGGLGTSVLPLAGCLGRFSGKGDTSGTPTTCEESTPSEVRTVTERATTESTEASTDEDLDWSLDYDLLVRHAGPLGVDTNRVVTVTVAETVEDDCNPVAFARRYELEPGAEVAVEDPLHPEAEGTYRIDARLASGDAATREIHVHGDGVPDSAGYTVEIQSDEVEIAKVQV